MFVIDTQGTDYIIRPMHRQDVLHKRDNQAEIISDFNMMMMTMALDHSQEYKKAEIIQFSRDVIVVANRLGNTIFNILSPIFDSTEEAIKFLNTTVCECGYGIAEFNYGYRTMICNECLREKETTR